MNKIIDKILHYIGLQTASSGTVMIADTNLHQTGYKAISINADTVFTILKDSEGTDMLVSQGITTTPCTAGSFITALKGKKIGQVQLTSGSIWGIV